MTLELLRRSGATREAVALSEQLEVLLAEAGDNSGLSADVALEQGHALNDLGLHARALTSLARAEDIARHDIDAGAPRKSVERHLATARALRALGREQDAQREVERARARWAELPNPLPTDELCALLDSWD